MRRRRREEEGGGRTLDEDFVRRFVADGATEVDVFRPLRRKTRLLLLPCDFGAVDLHSPHSSASSLRKGEVEREEKRTATGSVPKSNPPLSDTLLICGPRVSMRYFLCETPRPYCVRRRM
jgi:hypothetical protein